MCRTMLSCNNIAREVRNILLSINKISICLNGKVATTVKWYSTVVVDIPRVPKSPSPPSVLFLYINGNIQTCYGESLYN